MTDHTILSETRSNGRAPERSRPSRLVVWLTAATFFVFVAAVSAMTERGQDRLHAVLNSNSVVSNVAQGASPRDVSRLSAEVARLRGEVTRLGVANASLTERVAEFEADFGLTTAGIGDAEPPAERPNWQPAFSQQSPAGGRNEAAGGDVRVDFVPLPELAPLPMGRDIAEQDFAALAAPDARGLPPRLTATRFAIDLGPAPSISAARDIWYALSGSHHALIGALEPIITVEEPEANRIRIRLRAGPLINAADAAVLCERLSRHGVECGAAAFEGQKLAVR